MNPAYKWLALVVIAVTIWFSGDHHGQGVVNGKWNKERLATAAAVNAEHERQDRQRHVYETQVKEADKARDIALVELARVAALPHSHVLCHAAPASGIPAVPGISASIGLGIAASRPLPPNIDFDPTERLYAEIADAADYAVEQCRNALNRWPK